MHNYLELIFIVTICRDIETPLYMTAPNIKRSRCQEKYPLKINYCKKEMNDLPVLLFSVKYFYHYSDALMTSGDIDFEIVIFILIVSLHHILFPA